MGDNGEQGAAGGAPQFGTQSPGTGRGGGGVQASVNGIVTGATQLSTLVSTGLAPGSLAWVASVGAYFELVQPPTPLTVDNITVVNASGKTGYQWLRISLTNLAWAAVTTWHIDPVNGNDENLGTTAGVGNALKTCAEWNRRTYQATIGFVTVNLDNDIPDGDSIYSTCNGLSSSTNFLTIQGSQTVSTTQTLTVSTARAAATNQANEVTAGSFNWTTSVGLLSRNQGTSNYAAITKAVSATVGRMGELFNGSNQSSSTGYANGTNVEIVTTRKGPLIADFAGTVAVFLQDVRFDGSGAVQITNVQNVGGTIANRCIFAGTSVNIQVPGFQMWGGIVKSTAVLSPGEYRGTAFLTNSTFQSFGGASIGYCKLRSSVWQACLVTLTQMLLHVDGDLGIFDNVASTNQVNINGAGTGEGSGLSFLSGRHYGSGNNASSMAWNVGKNCQVIYLAAQPPVVTGGGVTINGGTTALASLPVALSTSTGSAVYSQ